MSRRWRYIEPGPSLEPIERVFTDEEILATYYAYWQERMRHVGKADQISPENCIEDWVVVNWAEEIKEER